MKGKIANFISNFLFILNIKNKFIRGNIFFIEGNITNNKIIQYYFYSIQEILSKVSFCDISGRLFLNNKIYI